MKNTYFHKVAVITIGAILTLSGSAFASTYKTEAVIHAKGLGNSEILVAQVSPLKNVPAFSKSVAIADTALGNALAAAQSQAIAGTGKSALAESISKATSKNLNGNRVFTLFLSFYLKTVKVMPEHTYQLTLNSYLVSIPIVPLSKNILQLSA